MTNTAQQEKRKRQDIARTQANTQQKSRTRTTVKKLETSIAANDKPSIGDLFKKAMSDLAQSAQRGLISRKAASRKISRMAKRIKANA